MSLARCLRHGCGRGVPQLGRVDEALSALADLNALGDEPPDTHLYNLVLGAATKVGPPRAALTVYHRQASPSFCNGVSLQMRWAVSWLARSPVRM